MPLWRSKLNQVTDFEKRLREAELQSLVDFKTGKADAPVLYRAAGYFKATQENGPLFVASEESEDRVGDVISITGWDLKQFQANPVFMFCHDYTTAPIGVVPKVWVEGKQLLNTVKWDEEDPLGKFIKGKYERGIMRAESVGFRALEYDALPNGGINFKRQELLEISAVPVPAHPAALRKMMADKKFQIIMPETVIFEPYIIGKPFPNEHACRLRSPDDFDSATFRRTTRKHEGKEYSVIMGKIKGESTMTEQAYRYPKDTWDAEAAKAHCSSHDGSFEAAAEGKSQKADMSGMADMMGQMREHMQAMSAVMDEMEGLVNGENQTEGILAGEADKIRKSIQSLKEA